MFYENFFAEKRKLDIYIAEISILGLFLSSSILFYNFIIFYTFDIDEVLFYGVISSSIFYIIILYYSVYEKRFDEMLAIFVEDFFSIFRTIINVFNNSFRSIIFISIVFFFEQIICVYFLINKLKKLDKIYRKEYNSKYGLSYKLRKDFLLNNKLNGFLKVRIGKAYRIISVLLLELPNIKTITVLYSIVILVDFPNNFLFLLKKTRKRKNYLLLANFASIFLFIILISSADKSLIKLYYQVILEDTVYYFLRIYYIIMIRHFEDDN